MSRASDGGEGGTGWADNQSPNDTKTASKTRMAKAVPRDRLANLVKAVLSIFDVRAKEGNPREIGHIAIVAIVLRKSCRLISEQFHFANVSGPFVPYLPMQFCRRRPPATPD